MLDKIIETVLKTLGVTRVEFESQSKATHIIDARYICMSLCRKYTDATLEQIGFRCGDRGHSNTINALQQSDNWYAFNVNFQNKYDMAEQAVLHYVKQFNVV